MPKVTCSVADCDSPAYCRGWCIKHYARWKRHGTTDPPTRALPTETRFWSYVDKTESCWLWTGATTAEGYGRFRDHNKAYAAHRFSWQLLVAPIPDAMELDHRCRVESCVNPVHLRVVTRKQNAEHMAGPQKNNKSGVRGVSWSKAMGRWQVSAKSNGKQHHGGFFASLGDAEAAAIALRNRLHTHNDVDRSERHGQGPREDEALRHPGADGEPSTGGPSR